MAVLIDTHALLWYVTSDSRLSDFAKTTIDKRESLFFSIASLWEIAIKLNIGKLQMTSSFDEILLRLDFLKVQVLPVEQSDIKTYVSLTLPHNHRDPFDRILVAQAMNRSLNILSRDEKFELYPVQRIWSGASQDYGTNN